MQIHIDRPILNRPTPEENLALVDKWIADTSDKLNTFITLYNREKDNASNNQTVKTEEA